MSAKDGVFHSDATHIAFGVGVEDTFIPQSSPGRRRLEEYELTQHYDHLDEDADLIVGSGAHFVRYGLPWYRLSPEPGRYMWDLADRMVDALVNRGLDIILDLVHYGTPTWLDNQFLNKDYPQVVADYAANLAERYGDRITKWTPLNEPQWTARLCGESGTWPPMAHGHEGYIRIMEVISRGIVLTHEAISSASAQEPTFVDVEASFRYDTAHGIESPEATLLSERRFLALDLITGRVGADHPLADYLTGHHPDIDLSWFADHNVTLDILGLNYYPMWSTMEYTPVGDVFVGVERDDGVHGLEDVLRTYHSRYHVPVMVTETSFEGSEAERIEWLHRAGASVRRLAAEIPVVGFTWWPFIDQVKWQYREGEDSLTNYLHRLGLVTVDAKPSGELSRRPNGIYRAYKRLAQASNHRETSGKIHPLTEESNTERKTK